MRTIFLTPYLARPRKLARSSLLEQFIARAAVTYIDRRNRIDSSDQVPNLGLIHSQNGGIKASLIQKGGDELAN